MKIRRWSFGKSLTGGLTLVFGIVAAVVLGCGLWMRQASATMSDLASNQLPELSLATAFEREILNARIHFIYHVTIQKPGALDAGWVRYRNAQALIPKLLGQVETSEALEPLREPTRELSADLSRYDELLRRILAAVANHQNSGEAFAGLIAEWAGAGAKVVKAAGDLQRQCSEEAMKRSHENSQVLRGAVLWTWAGGALASLLVGLLGWLGHGVSQSLTCAVGRLKQSARQLTGTSEQVRSASQAMASLAIEQASALETTSSSAEEVHAMALRNGDGTNSAAESVSHSQETLSSANQALNEMVTAMEELNAQSASISRIIQAIDVIAFQTNILALNAAVEAARAGEAGLGFGVVAQEVRALAQRCAQAARDTAELVEGSIAKTKSGKAKVDAVAQSMRAMTEESERVRRLVMEVRAGSGEQGLGIEQIAKTIQKMQSATESNAASARQGAASAEDLNAQSGELAGIVESLSTLVYGAR